VSGRRAIALYLMLVPGLAALGGTNQLRFERQIELMDAKQELISHVVALRAEAARVEGPHAVTAWAEEHGMVPAPENDRIENVAPLAPPVIPPLEGGLEVRTVWQ
jgi:hypothetical protein